MADNDEKIVKTLACLLFMFFHIIWFLQFYIFETRWTVILIYIAINIRFFYLLHKVKTNRHKFVKKMCKKSAKTLIVLGSGGHTSEMMRIIEHLSIQKYSPRIYLHANNDDLSKSKIQKFEQNNDDFCILSIPRCREVRQTLQSAIKNTLWAILYCIPVTFKRPDLLLCNGPGTCLPICIVIFFCKLFFISSTKIVYVESFCRVNSLSLTGIILYYFADNFIVQWPSLKNKAESSILV